MGIVYDPVSVNAASGTELMMRGLEKRLDLSFSNHFSIGRAIMLFPKDNKTKIYWTHNLPGQMNISEVSESAALHVSNRWKFVDKIVYVSEWQKQFYQRHYQFNEADQSRFKVLRNAITPIPQHTKPTDKIRLIYMSVPERGLFLLLNAFDKIAPKYPNVELEVFSSYKIYGIPGRDHDFRNLFARMQSNPQIKYNGTVSNQEIHNALQRAHIFAYPSTFMETSCIALVEAMSAGCLCVHSNIAALPETAKGFTNMYDYSNNRAMHEVMFEKKLEEAILQVQSGNTGHLNKQKEYTDANYSWDTRIQEWNDYLISNAK
jgi:glycosyltransferase involved in cell wall biosynthesis